MAWSVASLPPPPGVSRQHGTLAQPWTASSTNDAADVVTPHRTSSFKGSGLAVLRSDQIHPDADGDDGQQGSLSPSPSRATFSHLEYSFPLKLIHPRTSSHNASSQISTLLANPSAAAQRPNGVAALYIVSYGGGLVSGDQVELDIDVGPRCTLLTLTQGSTKVFKMRQQQVGKGSSPRSVEWTSQSFRYLIRPHALLLVLPDPVTPYSSARYAQTQRFDLRCAHSSQLVVLDWFTPGRVRFQQKPSTTSQGEGELWDFAAYSSRNEFRVAGSVVARDALLLEHPLQQGDTGTGSGEHSHSSGGNALAHAMHPFTIYGTLFLFASSGPVRLIVDSLRTEFSKIEQRRVRRSTSASPGSGSASAYSIREDSFSAETVIGQGGVEAGQVLWSLSDLPFQPKSRSSTTTTSESKDKHVFTVVRLAGTSTDAVKRWLALRLSLLEQLVGPDLFKASLVT
ncbi:unnamed protein product [Tilletia controversa]|uniref:Urease accessory protein n=3 Tax=Tilletia TaxID=13289 RepID=A0A8X7MR61_9BASI|nr:hypothetical protein CF336_g6525 [Tilletia laevis]KAE8194095.1 hypothetical protein CF328_g4855 [Tilletia controversa]KAE8260165.1 hypothetical protein A4X03_0g3896 [Tilletia caries]KAE8194292.1 hypothetical protein CF335_g5378 [Tilletia laevis]KAE8245482.1 hypothetical protein A4X06_0g5669 [Tilletia controversa]